MKIPANIFNALLTAMSKKDTRYYLNGILIDGENNCIVATDGYRLLKFDIEIEHDEKFIVGLDNNFKCTGKCDYVEINATTDLQVPVTFFDSTNKKIKTLYGDHIDAKFPDYNRVLPGESEQTEVNTIAFNHNFLYDVPKALKLTAIKMEFFGADGRTCRISDKSLGITYIVMAVIKKAH